MPGILAHPHLFVLVIFGKPQLATTPILILNAISVVPFNAKLLLYLSMNSSSIVNLKKNGIEADYLEMPRLGHGFGLGINQDSSVGVNWISRAVSFWSDVSDFSED